MALRKCFATALRACGASASGQLFAAAVLASLRTVASTPSCSCSYSTAAGADTNDVERAKLVNKLLYRSKQRGFLELDLLMGLWAEAQVPRMSLQGLKDFAKVLDEENPDLFKWLTGQLPTPEHLARNPSYMALKAHVDAQLDDHLHHAAAAAAGKEWVRGWDDPNKPPAGAATQAAANAAAAVAGRSKSS